MSSTIVALDTEGKLYVAGDNYYGQLGIGTTENSDDYICLNEIEGNKLYNKKIVQFETYEYFIIVRDNTGKIYSWGHNYYGQLGNLNISIDIAYWGSPKKCYVTEPVCISEQEGNALIGKNIVKLKRGNNSVYAIDSEGKLYTWGSGDYGLLCDGEEEDRSYPLCVSEMDGHLFNSIKIVNVTDYDLAAAAIDDNGNLYVWGMDFEGGILADVHPICINTIEDSGLYGKKIVHMQNDGKYDDYLLVFDSNGNSYKALNGVYLSEIEYNRNVATTKEIEGKIVNQSFRFEEKYKIDFYLTDDGNLYFSSELRDLSKFFL